MTVRRLSPLAAVLLTAGLAFGQAAPKNDAAPKEPAKPAPGSLEDTLEKALRNSADIKAAEAKVRDAEAELNRVRHQVLTKATALHSDLNLAKRMLAVAEATLAAAAERQKAGAVSGTEGLLTAQAMLEKHRGEVEKLEAELKALRGEFALRNHLGDVRSVAFAPDGRLLASAGPDGSVRVWDAATGRLLGEALTHAPQKTAPVAPGSMAERVRQLLDKEVEWEVSVGQVSDAVRKLLELVKSDVPMRNMFLRAAPTNTLFELKGKMPVGAWLQAIEDSDPDAVIVVREYGLLVTNKDRVPAGAIGVSELWKMKRADAKEKK